MTNHPNRSTLRPFPRAGNSPFALECLRCGTMHAQAAPCPPRPLLFVDERRVPLPGAACIWKPDADGTYETSCGQAFVFTAGGPRENDAKFCLHCGKPLATPTDNWRISWRSKLTGAKSHGEFCMDFAAAASSCSALNAKWPDLSHWPERRIDCCAYHRTGGFSYVGCKVDAYEPEIHADPPELDGTIADGMRAYERSRP